MTADEIRAICAKELDSDPGFPFFWASWKVEGDIRDTEHAKSLGKDLADAMLVQLFSAERPHHDSDLDTVLVMCHG